MPWIMPNNAAVDKAMKGAPGEKVKDLIHAKGIEPLAFGENGFRHWTNSKRPLATPDRHERPENPRTWHENVHLSVQSNGR